MSLEADEREAAGELLEAAADALNDSRLDDRNVWTALGMVAAVLRIAADDVRAGNRARLLEGGAARLPRYIDEAVGGSHGGR